MLSSAVQEAPSLYTPDPWTYDIKNKTVETAEKTIMHTNDIQRAKFLVFITYLLKSNYVFNL